MKKNEITVAGPVQSRDENMDGPYWFILKITIEDYQRIEYLMDIVKTSECFSVLDYSTQLEAYDDPLEIMTLADIILDNSNSDLFLKVEDNEVEYGDPENFVPAEDMMMVVTKDYIYCIESRLAAY